MDKLTIARLILMSNFDCALSGSLALKLQGLELRRESEDVDIWVPPDHKFIPISGMKLISSYSDKYGKNTVPENSYAQYECEGVDICVFKDTYTIEPIICRHFRRQNSVFGQTSYLKA